MQRVSTSPENAARIMQVCDEIDVRSLLPSVSVPTIVFQCDRDQIVPAQEGRILAAEILPIDSVRERLAREVAIRVKMPADRGVFEALGAVFARHRGDRRVSFEIELTGDAKTIRVKADVSAQIRVRPSSSLVAEVEQIVGQGAVQLR